MNLWNMSHVSALFHSLPSLHPQNYPDRDFLSDRLHSVRKHFFFDGSFLFLGQQWVIFHLDFIGLWMKRLVPDQNERVYCFCRFNSMPFWTFVFIFWLHTCCWRFFFFFYTKWILFYTFMLHFKSIQVSPNKYRNIPPNLIFPYTLTS